MSLFISESSDGRINLKKQTIHSLKHYSAASLILTVKTIFETLKSFSNSVNEKQSAQMLFPFLNLPDDLSRFFLPSCLCDILFQHMLDDPELSPDIILTIAPYLRLSLTKLSMHRIPCNRINEVFGEISASSLTSIDFSNNQLIDDSLICLLTSSSLSLTLKHLRLAGCTKFFSIKILYAFSNLLSLDLSQNSNLIFEPSHCLFCRFQSLLTNFRQLTALDLHMTNFIYASVGLGVCVAAYAVCKIAGDCKLQRLDLHTEPQQNLSESETYLDFYEMLLVLKNISHLDISGWPFLNLFPKESLLSLSNNKEFFGIYLTGLTDRWGDSPLVLAALEISGFSNEEQAISTLQHYYTQCIYMEKFLFNLATNLLQNDFKLTINSINILTEYLYKTVIYYFRKNPTGSNHLINTICCLASITEQDEAELPLDMVQKLVEFSAELLHNTNIQILENPLDIVSARTVLNCFATVENFMSLDLFNYKLNATHQIFYKLATEIIARGTEILESRGVFQPHFFQLLDNIFKFVNNILRTCQIESRCLFGSHFKGVDLLMKYLSVKLELDQIDDEIRCASGSLMSATYLCYTNCLIASSVRNSEILYSLIEKKGCKIERIMGTLENIAEISLQYESTHFLNILPAINAILIAPEKHNLDTITSSLAAVAYLATGREKWGWAVEVSEIDSLLDFAEAIILKRDYKEGRDVLYTTLDYFFQCLSSSDVRIHLCVIWLVTNLMFKNPKMYSKMVNKDFLNKVKSLLGLHPKSSHLHFLAVELLALYAIGSYSHE